MHVRLSQFTVITTITTIIIVNLLLLPKSISTVDLANSDNNNGKNIIIDRESPLLVQIYYETLNSAVWKFFVEQWRPLIDQKFIDEIDLRVYPYGNTSYDATQPIGKRYTCVYGDEQCEANKLHGCLIQTQTPSEPVSGTLTNSTAVALFLSCFFKNRYSKDELFSLGEECADVNGLTMDWITVHNCVQQSGHEDIFDHFRDKTEPIGDAIKKDGLVVQIGDNKNGSVVVVDGEESKKNFIAALCRALGNSISSKYPICAQSSLPSKVQLSIYYEANSPTMATYVSAQLSTYYHVLEDFVDIDLIPYGTTVYNATTDQYQCATAGEWQCVSNKFQSLVVAKYLWNPPNGDMVYGANRVMNFLTCLVEQEKSLATATVAVVKMLENCANQQLEAGDFEYFEELIRDNRTEYRTVFDSMRDKTVQLLQSNNINGLPRIPTVAINGVIDYNAFNDLVQEACAQYKGIIKSSICTKVNVTVLYETSHHKSRKFFLEQLNPIFNHLQSLIDLEMIPAGRMIHSPGNGFVCPNSVEQCTGIRLHACALDNYWNDGDNYTDPIRQEVFKFIQCTFKNKPLLDVMNVGEICAEDQFDFDAWFQLAGCMHESTIDGVLMDYVERTQSMVVDVGHQNMPIILINGVEAQNNTPIQAQICAFFDEYHSPDYCLVDPPAKVQLNVYYESAAELAKYFFTAQYDPWYMYVEEMVNITLIPAGNVRETNHTDGTCDSYDEDSQCYANKIQALIIDRYNNHDDDGDWLDGQMRTMKYLSCVFNHPQWRTNVYIAGEYCTEQWLPYDDWFNLLITAKSPTGGDLYKQAIDTTDQLLKANNLTLLEPIPWVTLNGAQHHSKRAADDLLQTVCDNYEGDKPPECTPVQVELYYSAINAQSRRFFLEQMLPVFRSLRERIQLSLIPYGMTNASLTMQQECATRDKICLANKVQACAIDRYFDDEHEDTSIQWDGKNQTLMFIWCMFKNIEDLNIMQLAEQCAIDNIILADEVIECARESEGDKLLEMMRNQTLELVEPLEHTPWVLINGERVYLAESDLKDAICDAMVGDKPDYCFQPTPSKVSIQFHYTSLSLEVSDYVINELYPNYRLLEEIIDLDVVPYGQMEMRAISSGSNGTVNNYTVWCPIGGDAECRGNLVHACVYGRYFHDELISNDMVNAQYDYDGRLEVLQFINCYFSSPFYPDRNVDAAEECVEQIFGDDWSIINECAHGILGKLMLESFVEEKVSRLLPELTYTPWITVNGKHSYTIENHFTRTICDTYQGIEKPTVCYETQDDDNVQNRPYVEIHYEPTDHSSATVDFFTNNQSLPIDILVNISDIHLIPFGRSTMLTNTSYNCVGDDADGLCSQYKEHACLIKLFLTTEPVATLSTIACTFTDDMYTKPDRLLQCANQYFTDDPWEQVEGCLRVDANALMAENAAIVQALSPRISHVPWIRIDEEHNLEAEVTLVNELCATYYPKDKPKQCQPVSLPVSIYYETMNDAMANFVLDQFSQYIEYFDEIGNFSFIPYGRTTGSNNNWNCPNGALQCQANKIHTCLLNRYYNLSAVNTVDDQPLNHIRVANFIECAFVEQISNSTANATQTAKYCIEQEFDDFNYPNIWQEINSCATGLEGEQLYEEMGRETNALVPPLGDTIPYIQIDGKYSDRFAVNFFQAICDSYSLVKVPLCVTISNSLAVPVAVYFSSDATAQTFLRTQLLPFFAEVVPVLSNIPAAHTMNNKDDDTENEAINEVKLHSMIAVQFVPWGNTKYNSSNADSPFTCASANECYLNRLIACANYYHGNEPKANIHIPSFVLCLLTNNETFNKPTDIANACESEIWLTDLGLLNQCAIDNTEEGVNIYLKARDRTANNYPEITTFPSVTINEMLDPDARNDLMHSVCNSYKGFDYPKECQKPSSNALSVMMMRIISMQSITLIIITLISSFIIF